MGMNWPITPVKITIKLNSANAGNATYLCSPSLAAIEPVKTVNI